MSCCSTTRWQSLASSCRHFSDGGLKHIKSLCINCLSRTITLAQALQISKRIVLQGVAVAVLLHHMHWSIKRPLFYCNSAINVTIPKNFREFSGRPLSSHAGMTSKVLPAKSAQRSPLLSASGWPFAACVPATPPPAL